MPKLTEATQKARKSQIIQAAMDCFLDHGYSATTMAQIISKSGLSCGSIYSHFSSKEEILREAITSNLAGVKETTPLPGKVLPPRQLAHQFFNRLDVARGAKIMLTVWREASTSTKTGEVLLHTLEEITDFLAEVLLPWAKLHTPAGIDTCEYSKRTARVLMAVAHGALVRITLDSNLDRENFVNDAFSLLPGE